MYQAVNMGPNTLGRQSGWWTACLTSSNSSTSDPQGHITLLVSKKQAVSRVNTIVAYK